jgi:hypothetical protein
VLGTDLRDEPQIAKILLNKKELGKPSMQDRSDLSENLLANYNVSVEWIGSSASLSSSTSSDSFSDEDCLHLFP